MCVPGADGLRAGFQPPMNGQPRADVSVVIPCHNQARYLPSSIGSAQAQTHAPFEIIVVDDGSSDDTAAVAAARGATVIRQKNAGVSAARNAGLRAARGEFVVFLDADDELLPAAVETGVQALSLNPVAVCAVGRTRPMDVDGREMVSAAPRPVVTNLYEEWLSDNFVSTPGAAIFRRLPLEANGGFPEGVGPAADYAIYLQLARTGVIVDHGHVVARYRSHSASMSRDSREMLRATMRVLRREKRMLPAEHRAAFHRGRARWADDYGSQIIEWMREDWRARGPRLAQLSALGTLMRYCPSLVATRAASRLTRALASPRARRNRNPE